MFDETQNGYPPRIMLNGNMGSFCAWTKIGLNTLPSGFLELCKTRNLKRSSSYPLFVYHQYSTRLG